MFELRVQLPNVVDLALELPQSITLERACKLFSLQAGGAQPRIVIETYRQGTWSSFHPRDEAFFTSMLVQFEPELANPFQHALLGTPVHAMQSVSQQVLACALAAFPHMHEATADRVLFFAICFFGRPRASRADLHNEIDTWLALGGGSTVGAAGAHHTTLALLQARWLLQSSRAPTGHAGARAAPVVNGRTPLELIEACLRARAPSGAGR